MKYDEITIPIIPTLASDMKATCSILGLSGPKSNFPCFICEAHKNDFRNYRGSFIQRNKATEDEIMNNGGVHPTKLYNNQKTNWGYKHPSLLGDYITYNQVVIEILHMWLRITGRLFQNLARDIVNISVTTIDKLDRAKHKEFNAYFQYLHEVCNLKSVKPFPKNERGAESLHGDMNGDDTEKFVSKLFYLRSLFDYFDDGESKFKIWTLFYKIYMKIRHNGYLSSGHLKKDTWEWMDLYIHCYNENTITPYMHIFAVHLHEQMEKFGNISYFCTQGIVWPFFA